MEPSYYKFMFMGHYHCQKICPHFIVVLMYINSHTLRQEQFLLQIIDSQIFHCMNFNLVI